MKKAFTICIFGLLLFVSTSLYSQNECDGLNIVDIYMNPIGMEMLIIKVENASEQIFDYPGFKVFHDGEEIGAEVVTFFGIGLESTHFIPLENPFSDGEEVELTLELWTGFYDSLACTSEWTGKPFDTSECFEIDFSLQWGGGPGDFLNMVMYDQTTEEEVFNDEGFFDIVTPSFTQTMCLEQGCYIYKVTGNETLQSNYYISLYDQNFFSYYNNNSAEGDQGVTDLIEVWEGCEVQSVNEEARNEFQLYPNPSNGNYTISSLNKVQQVTVSDLGGKVIAQQNGVVPLPRIGTAGMYLVTVLFEDGSVQTHQLIVE